MATNAYDYFSDIQNIYNAKSAWNLATTEAERKKQSEIADAARKRLEAYGYGDIAKQLSASGADATAARKIMEQYAPKTSATVETNNLKSAEVNRENAGSFDKHNEVYDYIMNTNPFETETGKAILAKYDLSGLNARENAVASGGASNGGNIDSYAAANALRQQAALVNQGQTAVLDAHQQKIDNARGILSDIGINIDRVFNQDETSKNNDVARKSEIASVTGYVPTEWTIQNNPYLNSDGTIKDQYKDVDFSAVMAKAKASGNTDAYNYAATARYYKIMSDYGKYGKYDDGNYIAPGAQKTEARRQFDENTAVARETLGAEVGMNAANNQNTLDQLNLASQNGGKVTVDKNGKVVVESDGNSAGEQEDWSTFTTYFSDENIVNFLNQKLKPYFDNGIALDQATLEKLIVGDDVENSNSTTYDIDVEEAREIINQLNIILKAKNPSAEPYDDSFLDNYTNRTWFNKGKGMKLK